MTMARKNPNTFQPDPDQQDANPKSGGPKNGAPKDGNHHDPAQQRTSGVRANAIPRLVPRAQDERFTMITVGRKREFMSDSYVRLLNAPWRHLFLIIASAYMVINLSFALLYFLGDGGIENARPGSFLDAFFFSVQTLATIGYGRMAPISVYANLLVTVEAFLGFAFYGMITGLVFAKFSRPTARVLFSKIAVISPYQNVPHLMLRMANERTNRIADVRAQLVLLQEDVTPDGRIMRRFTDLPLARDQVPLMVLTWTVMHKIDEHSPLFGVTPESLRERNAEIIISITGLDESFAQTIHARYSYVAEDILCNHVFEDVIHRSPEDRRIEIHYHKFHNAKPYQPIENPAMDNPEPRIVKAEDDPAFAEFVKMCAPE